MQLNKSCWLTFSLMIFLGLGRIAFGQTLIGGEMVTSTKQLTINQEDKIQRFVSQYARILVLGENMEDYGPARDQLVGQLRRPGVTKFFIKPYSRIVVEEIQNWEKHKSKMARQNAMIVLSYMKDPAVIQSIRAGLNDKFPAVRYWAAKGAFQLNENDQILLSEENQDELLIIITEAMLKEKSGPIMVQLYKAMSGLRVEDARKKLFEILTKRIDTYLPKGMKPSIQGEKVGLDRVLQQMILENSREGMSSDQVNELTIVTAKYLELIRRDVAAGKDSDEMKPIILSMLEVIQRQFNFALKVNDPNAIPGPTLVTPYRKGDSATFQLHVFDWLGTKDRQGALTTRLNIARSKYLLPEPPAPKESNQP